MTSDWQDKRDAAIELLQDHDEDDLLFIIQLALAALIKQRAMQPLPQSGEDNHG